MLQAVSEKNCSKAGTQLDRRKFLGIAGTAMAVGATAILMRKPALVAAKSRGEDEKSVKYGMVIDLERCMGCRACMEACKVENNTTRDAFWMYVFRFEEGKYPEARYWFLPRPCMHCDNPPCVRVCPVGATYKDETGRVMQDASRCIGCRFCMQACPYGARFFNDMDPYKNYYLDWKGPQASDLEPVTRGAIPPYQNPDLDKSYSIGLPEFKDKKAKLAGGGKLKGVVEKCTFCLQRVDKGLEPACVANCPVRALIFGDLNNPNSEVSRRLAKKQHFRLLDEFGTEPKVMYIGEAHPGHEVREFSPVNEKKRT